MNSFTDDYGAIIAAETTVSVTSASTEDGQWLVTGTVGFSVMRESSGGGLNEEVATIEFPFDDAKDENEAIQQAREQLDIVLRSLSELSQRLASR